MVRTALILAGALGLSAVSFGAPQQAQAASPQRPLSAEDPCQNYYTRGFNSYKDCTDHLGEPDIINHGSGNHTGGGITQYPPGGSICGYATRIEDCG